MNDAVPMEAEGNCSAAAALAAIDEGLATFDVTVLPMSQTESGLFVYHEEAIDLVKNLRAVGVEVGYAHKPDARTYHAERSVEVAVAFLINIASAAVWQAVLMALDVYRSREKLSVSLVNETAADGSERRVATFDGKGADVLEAMRIYRDGGSAE